ncbi:ISEnfa3, transposase [Enterococcus faecium]|nr:ISEnfa3, transposase [Enterococcus faecium]
MNLLLSIAQLAKSTYYYWVKKLDKPDKYSKIKQEITAIVKESRNSYGYRRVTLALKMKGYKINRTLVRHWVRIYNYHGWEGLVGGGKSYTTKFKLDVIEYMETNGLSIQETAKKFNIGSNRTLSKWIEQYEEGGASSLESQKRGRKISMNSKLNIPKKLKDESLEEEVIRLRAENAYLKKLETLIQEQDLSKKKSRLKQSFSSKKNLN